MSPIWAPKVGRLRSFDQDVDALREKYPAIDDVVEELADFLTIAWNPPHVGVDPTTLPGVYTTQLDYPAFGAGGLSKFIVVYHASAQAANPMQEPLRRYTLISLIEG